ncbi:(2Fe-2S)-binding protein [Streptomyces malaysiensis]|uniref:(2Fe-2S)-binding protein n=1 Tax=Streptomyces malaysiensis subsp. samsunensis TaxID=459658 RepID=A0A9X2MAQ7_STRMQ|nr:(2Fe-2S)-binding protein [Streptomyces samsunensis]MCQ8836299.1 (2Fe-2S)-binding protein [Streptomyces samsunensis]
MSVPISTIVNGQSIDLAVDPRSTLVDLLREQLGLTGTHVGCRTASCGACTVVLDGNTVKSCCVLAAEADGRSVQTIEGHVDGERRARPGELDDVQEAFVQVQGMQCGFCTPGMVLSVRALLAANPDPTDQEAKAAIAGNLCRCTGYVNILRAIRRVADERAHAKESTDV